jgi:hypothetical protein
MDEQLPLFGEEQPPSYESPSASLRIVKQNAAPLSKDQRNFNRLLEEVELWREKLAARAAFLDECLAFYAGTLHPLNQTFINCHKEVVRSLAPAWRGQIKPALGKNQMKTLGDALLSLLRIIKTEEEGLHDDDLIQLRKALVAAGVKDSEAAEFEHFRIEMEELCEKEGLDVDFSNFTSDAPPEQIAAILAELSAKAKQLYQEEENQRQTAQPEDWKTRKELAREQQEQRLEEARSRSIGTIYRQLARILHPDLEMDPQRKVEKEALMKQLTVAYKQGDIYSLLKLELEWIRGEEGDTSRLSEKKLAIYNEVLEEQCRTLEREYRNLHMQPRYCALKRYCSPYEGFSFDRENEKTAAQEKLQRIETTVARLHGPHFRDELRAILKFFR